MSSPSNIFETKRSSTVADRNIYETGQYLEKNPRWDVDESAWKARQVLRMIERNDLHPKTICDVGCGAGEVLKQLQEKMPQNCCFCGYCGYEISPDAFVLCQLRTNKGLDFKLMEIRDEKEVFFDLILVLDVEHLEDYFSFLREIQPKSQHKIFHIPLDLSVQTVFRPYGLAKRRDMYAHLHYFTKDIVLRIFEDLHYRVLDYFYTPRSIELAEEPIQRVLKLPRKVFFRLHQDFAVRVLGGLSLLVLAK